MRLIKRVLSNLTFSYVSQIKTKRIEDVLSDECLVHVMHQGLNQFVRNNMWYLVPTPNDCNIICTNWIFKNKTDDQGTMTRYNIRLVAQGYTQVEDVDFEETFTPVTRLKSIRILLVVTCTLGLLY